MIIKNKKCAICKTEIKERGKLVMIEDGKDKYDICIECWRKYPDNMWDYVRMLNKKTSR
jgi:hypothetical protein